MWLFLYAGIHWRDWASEARPCCCTREKWSLYFSWKLWVCLQNFYKITSNKSEILVPILIQKYFQICFQSRKLKIVRKTELFGQLVVSKLTLIQIKSNRLALRNLCMCGTYHKHYSACRLTHATFFFSGSSYRKANLLYLTSLFIRLVCIESLQWKIVLNLFCLKWKLPAIHMEFTYFLKLLKM